MSFHPSMGAGIRPAQAPDITLVIPGLVWPASDIAASLHRDPPIALSAMLGRAKITKTRCRTILDWLNPEGSGQLPLGRMRLSGEPAQDHPPPTETGSVLCADPVSLFFARDALLVLGPQHLSITAEETGSMIGMLNREFADLGQFWAASPTRWYLQTDKPCARFQPIEDADGRPAALFQPEGEHAKDWSRICNEIQIAMHAHPANEIRVQENQPRINALWFWGDGDQSLRLTGLQATRLFSKDPLLCGIFTRAGLSTCPPDSTALLKTKDGSNLWFEQRLQTAMLDGSMESWHNALTSLEQDLLNPLWRALCTGQVRSLKILVPADKGGFEATLDRQSRWKIWRSPMKTGDLCALLQGSR